MQLKRINLFRVTLQAGPEVCVPLAVIKLKIRVMKIHVINASGTLLWLCPA
jgi:hypothetical protein